MTTNVFDYFEDLPAREGSPARWAARAPRRRRRDCDLKLFPRSPRWQDDADSLAALERLSCEPWAGAVEHDRDGVRVRLADGWIERAGAALEAEEILLKAHAPMATIAQAVTGSGSSETWNVELEPSAAIPQAA
jgi:hypothetical protein